MNTNHFLTDLSVLLSRMLGECGPDAALILAMSC